MGIKGVGVAALAVIAKQAGAEVVGSDISEEFITDKILKSEGIDILEGFKEENVRDFFENSDLKSCLFIATGAHDGFENIESVTAKELGIKVVSHGEAVGMFMKGDILGHPYRDGISVAGAHGKTTVSSMIATVLSLGSYDPGFAIGTSEIFPIGVAAHFGLGDYFVAEADEYFAEKQFDPTPKFMYQDPSAILINNIDFDHPDVYKNIEEIKNAFAEFLTKSQENGLLVVNGDDANIQDVLSKVSLKPKTLTFGTDEKNDFVLSDFKQDGFSSIFSVNRNGMMVGDFSLQVAGYHNAKNATGVVALLMELGIPIEKIRRGLAAFKGVKRRMETIGRTKLGQIVIDDYAHHPEEIKKTLEAIKSAFPGAKITTIFQFHTFSRTKALFSDFISSFSSADEIVLLPTFASKRDESTNEDYDQKIIDEFTKLNKRSILLPDEASVVEYISKNLSDPRSVIVTMGAGDVYKIAYKLVTSQ